MFFLSARRTDVVAVNRRIQGEEKMKMKQSPFDVLLRKGLPRLSGSISGIPLLKPVNVIRDGFGIPHIFAQNEQDLMAAQGFVHAQDRLWQMEMTRRFSTGRLSEIVGEETLELDLFTKIMGFDRLIERAVSHVAEEDRVLLESYTAGINAFIQSTEKHLPLEFRTLKCVPAPWKIEDIGGSLAINAWFLQTNFQEEILALLCRKRLNASQWNKIFPSSPGEKLPEEDFFHKFRDIRIGKLLPEALAYYSTLALPPAASNNWIVSDATNGHPLLANDLHLSMMVPQIWYFCHLHCPTLNVIGASMPGSPGIIIGRNERIAWGVTNMMTDCVDLYVLKVDPGNPRRYFVEGQAHEIDVEELSIPLRGGMKKKAHVLRTIHGTVLTEVEEGVEAVVVLKWYGTLHDNALLDSTISGFFSLIRAGSVKEAFEACRSITSIGQNFVIGDVQGNIGWHTTGAVPVRQGYSGRLPADGSSGEHGWEGFLPREQMPHSYNPRPSRIVTANHKTTTKTHPHSITHSWCAPYRFERIEHLIGELSCPTVDDFRKAQMDSHSLQAEKILPTLLRFSCSDPLAREAQEILRNWDCTMQAESRPALVFNVFLVQFACLLLGDLLGDALPLFLSLMGLTYTGVDEVLGPGGSKSGGLKSGGYRSGSDSHKEILGDRSLETLCEESLKESIQFICRTLGKNRRKWSWGRLHTYLFMHPAGRGGNSSSPTWKARAASWLLNRGPYPAPGNGSTLNAAVFNPGHRGGFSSKFAAHTIPSLRMVADLSHMDRTYIIGPMGQSGQPGSRHYADMINPWLHGLLTPIPLTREEAEKIGRHTLKLYPEMNTGAP